MPFIDFKAVSKDYKLGRIIVHALRDVSFSLEKGTFTTLMGPSGSGKSTLLNILGLIDFPTNGSIYVNNRIIEFRKDTFLTEFRRDNIGFIFQHFNLIPIFNVFENIEFPILSSRLSFNKRKKSVMSILDKVGIPELYKRMPYEISGGQQQRVAIGRALIRDPGLIIADEPTANLDSETGKRIVSLLHSINKEKNTTIVLATHDPEILNISDRIMKLHDGLIVEG